MDWAVRARVVWRDQQEGTIDDNVHDCDDFGCILRQPWEHEHAQNSKQHGQGDELTHGVEEGGNALRVHDEWCNDNRNTACNGAVDLTDLYTLAIRCVGINRGAIQIQSEHGGCRV